MESPGAGGREGGGGGILAFADDLNIKSSRTQHENMIKRNKKKIIEV